MLTSQTIDKLLDMKLNGMSQSYERQIKNPEILKLCFEERFAMIVDEQWLKRENNLHARLVRAAGFPVHAAVEDIDYHAKRSLKKSQIVQLINTNWMMQGLNLILTGPTGVGKTYIACAMGNMACKRNQSVRYYRISKLLEELACLRASGNYLKAIKSLQKCNVLILDDWGLNSFTTAESRDLLDVIEERNLKKSTIIVSQIPVENWVQVLPDPTIADAIMDRIINNAYRLDIEGDSMRKLRSQVKDIGADY